MSDSKALDKCIIL